MLSTKNLRLGHTSVLPSVGLVVNECIVERIIKGSSSDDSGAIQVGDTILSVNGKKVNAHNISMHFRGRIGENVLVTMRKKKSNRVCHVALERRGVTLDHLGELPDIIKTEDIADALHHILTENMELKSFFEDQELSLNSTIMHKHPFETSLEAVDINSSNNNSGEEEEEEKEENMRKLLLKREHQLYDAERVIVNLQRELAMADLPPSPVSPTRLESIAPSSKPLPVSLSSSTILIQNPYEPIAARLLWKSNERVDIDIGAALFAADGSHVEDVYFSRPQGQQGAIRHLGDTNSASGDESLQIQLDKIDNEVSIMFLTACIYNKDKDFSCVQGCCFHAGSMSGGDLCSISLDAQPCTAVVACALLRDSMNIDQWHLEVLSVGLPGRTVRELRPHLQQLVVNRPSTFQKQTCTRQQQKVPVSNIEILQSELALERQCRLLAEKEAGELKRKSEEAEHALSMLNGGAIAAQQIVQDAHKQLHAIQLSREHSDAALQVMYKMLSNSTRAGDVVISQGDVVQLCEYLAQLEAVLPALDSKFSSLLSKFSSLCGQRGGAAVDAKSSTEKAARVGQLLAKIKNGEADYEDVSELESVVTILIEEAEQGQSQLDEAVASEQMAKLIDESDGALAQCTSALQSYTAAINIIQEETSRDSASQDRARDLWEQLLEEKKALVEALETLETRDKLILENEKLMARLKQQNGELERKEQIATKRADATLGQVISLQQEVAVLREFQSLESDASVISELAHNNSTLLDQLKQCQQDLNRENAQSSELKEAVGSLRSQLNSIESLNQELQANVADLQEKLGEGSGRDVKSSSTNGSHHHHIAKLQDDAHKISLELAVAQCKNDGLIRDFGTFKTRLQNAEAALGNTERSLAAAHAEIAVRKEHEDAAMKRAMEMEAKQMVLLQQLEEARAQMSEWKANISHSSDMVPRQVMLDALKEKDCTLETMKTLLEQEQMLREDAHLQEIRLSHEQLKEFRGQFGSFQQQFIAGDFKDEDNKTILAALGGLMAETRELRTLMIATEKRSHCQDADLETQLAAALNTVQRLQMEVEAERDLRIGSNGEVKYLQRLLADMGIKTSESNDTIRELQNQVNVICRERDEAEKVAMVASTQLEASRVDKTELKKKISFMEKELREQQAAMAEFKRSSTSSSTLQEMHAAVSSIKQQQQVAQEQQAQEKSALENIIREMSLELAAASKTNMTTQVQQQEAVGKIAEMQTILERSTWMLDCKEKELTQCHMEVRMLKEKLRNESEGKSKMFACLNEAGILFKEQQNALTREMQAMFEAHTQNEREHLHREMCLERQLEQSVALQQQQQLNLGKQTENLMKQLEKLQNEMESQQEYQHQLQQAHTSMQHLQQELHDQLNTERGQIGEMVAHIELQQNQYEASHKTIRWQSECLKQLQVEMKGQQLETRDHQVRLHRLYEGERDEMKTQIQQTQDEMKTQIQQTQDEMKTQIQQTQNEMKTQMQQALELLRQYQGDVRELQEEQLAQAQSNIADLSFHELKRVQQQLRELYLQQQHLQEEQRQVRKYQQESAQQYKADVMKSSAEISDKHISLLEKQQRLQDLQQQHQIDLFQRWQQLRADYEHQHEQLAQIHEGLQLKEQKQQEYQHQYQHQYEELQASHEFLQTQRLKVEQLLAEVTNKMNEKKQSKAEDEVTKQQQEWQAQVMQRLNDLYNRLQQDESLQKNMSQILEMEKQQHQGLIVELRQQLQQVLGEVSSRPMQHEEQMGKLVEQLVCACKQQQQEAMEYKQQLLEQFIKALRQQHQESHGSHDHIKSTENQEIMQLLGELKQVVTTSSSCTSKGVHTSVEHILALQHQLESSEESFAVIRDLKTEVVVLRERMKSREDEFVKAIDQLQSHLKVVTNGSMDLMVALKNAADSNVDALQDERQKLLIEKDSLRQLLAESQNLRSLAEHELAATKRQHETVVAQRNALEKKAMQLEQQLMETKVQLVGMRAVVDQRDRDFEMLKEQLTRAMRETMNVPQMQGEAAEMERAISEAQSIAELAKMKAEKIQECWESERMVSQALRQELEHASIKEEETQNERDCLKQLAQEIGELSSKVAELTQELTNERRTRMEAEARAKMMETEKRNGVDQLGLKERDVKQLHFEMDKQRLSLELAHEIQLQLERQVNERDAALAQATNERNQYIERNLYLEAEIREKVLYILTLEAKQADQHAINDREESSGGGGGNRRSEMTLLEGLRKEVTEIHETCSNRMQELTHTIAALQEEIVVQKQNRAAAEKEVAVHRMECERLKQEIVQHRH